MKKLKIGIKRHLLNRRLKAFEKGLVTEKVTADRVDPLFGRLSGILRDFKHFQISNPFVQDDLDHIVSLFGKIISLHQEHEVSLIQKRADEIDGWVERMQVEKLSAAVDALRYHIATFCEDNRPSKEGRTIIALAKESADRAEAFLNNKEWNPAERLYFESDDELAEDLFEIGYLYFSGKQNEATREFNILPEEIKKRFYHHLVDLGGNPFDLQIDPIKWMQALIATGYDVSNTSQNDYLNRDEVEAFFSERHSLDG